MSRGRRALLVWTLVAIGAMLPVWATGVYAIRVTARSMRKMVHASNIAAAVSAAETLRANCRGAAALTQTVGNFPTMRMAVKNHDVALVRERLRRIVEENPLVDRAAVLDPAGILWSDYPVAPETLGKSFAFRDYFKGAMRTGGPHVSEVYQRVAEPRPMVVAIASPVRDEKGEIIGVLMMQHRLSAITGWLQDVPVGEGGHIVVLDQRGVVAGHPGLDLEATQFTQYADVPEVKEALTGQHATRDYVDPISGKLMTATFTPVPVSRGTTWVVIAQQDRDEAMEAVSVLRRQIVIAAVLVGMAALGGGVALARVSERNRRMREELAERHAALEQASRAERQAHEALKRAQATLVQSAKLAGLGQMVAGVAHEINNPLSFVSNNVAVMQRDLKDLPELLALYREAEEKVAAIDPALAEKIRAMYEKLDIAYTMENLPELLARSREGLRRIQQIVKDLRDFARMDENALHEADWNAGVESTIGIIQGRAKKKGVTIDFSPGPMGGSVVCNPGRVNQVVMNLLANAIDATPAGGKVTVRTWHENGRAYLEVADTGEGMTEAVRARLFEPFFTTKPQGAGTGLGLAISYGIVKDHQGGIEVESELAKGSRFVVWVPEGGAEDDTVAR